MGEHIITDYLRKLIEKEGSLQIAGKLRIGNRQIYKKLFENEGFFDFLSKSNMEIEREKLELYARECFDKEDFTNPLLATMAWGYIEEDVGPCRVFNLWNDSDRFNNKVLSEVRCKLKENDIASAYKWAKTLAGVGDVFASKILYILSVGIAMDYYPVIIDRRVINSIDKISPELVGRYCRRSKSGDISSGKQNYLDYCKDLARISKELNCLPSDIELILFNWNGGAK